MCKRAGVLASELRTLEIGYTMTVNRRSEDRFAFGDILFADERGEAHERLWQASFHILFGEHCGGGCSERPNAGGWRRGGWPGGVGAERKAYGVQGKRFSLAGQPEAGTDAGNHWAERRN